MMNSMLIPSPQIFKNSKGIPLPLAGHNPALQQIAMNGFPPHLQCDEHNQGNFPVKFQRRVANPQSRSIIEYEGKVRNQTKQEIRQADNQPPTINKIENESGEEKDGLKTDDIQNDGLINKEQNSRNTSINRYCILPGKNPRIDFCYYSCFGRWNVCKAERYNR